MKKLAWYLIHYGVIAMFVLGVVFNVQGALNVAVFFTCVIHLPLSFVSLFADFGQQSIKTAKPDSARPLNVAARWACLVMLVWFGAWFSAMAYGFYSLATTVAHWRAKPQEAMTP